MRSPARNAASSLCRRSENSALYFTTGGGLFAIATRASKVKAWRDVARDAREKIGNKYATFRTFAVEGVALWQV